MHSTAATDAKISTRDIANHAKNQLRTLEERAIAMHAMAASSAGDIRNATRAAVISSLCDDAAYTTSCMSGLLDLAGDYASADDLREASRRTQLQLISLASDTRMLAMRQPATARA